MNIVILGPQGCGKTTQADLLAKKLEYPRVSAGDISRSLASKDSELGHQVKRTMATGALVPDDIIIPALEEELSQPQYKNGVIVDGFPRNVYEAEHAPFKIDKIIYLKITEETSIKRMLLRKRADDIPELIKAHLDVYHKETGPVLDYYRSLGTLIEINGEPTEFEIFAEICQKLNLTA